MEPLSVTDPLGRNFTWHRYEVEFTSPDGKFTFPLYAISDDHAELQLQAVKETARVSGRTIALIGDGH